MIGKNIETLSQIVIKKWIGSKTFSHRLSYIKHDLFKVNDHTRIHLLLYHINYINVH